VNVGVQLRRRLGIVIAAAAVAGTSPAHAAPRAESYPGLSYGSVLGSVTASKPES
jgi:hypothetical protein